MKLIRELPEVFEEFESQKKAAFLEIKEYKERGIPIIGTYCAYFPVELAIAMGAIPVGLCSTSNETIAIAEQEMPKSMCPMVKSSYGFALSDRCPFFHFSDLIVGETTCDGKKKMYELLAEMKPVFVMELPNSQSKAGLEFWKKEIIRTKIFLEDFFDTIITDEQLKEAIKLQNRIRCSLRRLCETMKLDPPPVYGSEIKSIIKGTKYRYDYQSTLEVIDAITERILKEYDEGKMLERKPRILVTGCPIGGDSMKVIEAVEKNGGIVVAIENCSGVKTFDRLVDEENPDFYEAIAQRYLATGCSIMTPNDNRVELLGRTIDEYKVDGVVEMILSGCHSTGAESIYIRKFVNEEKGIPYLAIDTDHSNADRAQIETRVTALLEMINVQKMENSRRIKLNKCHQIMLAGIAKREDISETLFKLCQYTNIPLLLCDENNGVKYQYGMNSPIVTANNKRDYVEITFSEGKGTCLAECVPGYSQQEIKAVLEVIVRNYLLGKELQYSRVKNKGDGLPDYLWIATDNGSNVKGLLGDIKRHFLIFKSKIESGKFAFLISDLSGKEGRAEVIEICREFTNASSMQIVVGNGFKEKNKMDANCKLVLNLLDKCKYLNGRKKVFLIEDFYQKMIVEQMIQRCGVENYRLEELEKLKKEDSQMGSSLYDTLYYYLLMRRNSTHTAAKMKIHRTTLFNRLVRINEILHLNEKSSLECKRLLLSIQLEKEEKIIDN